MFDMLCSRHVRLSAVISVLLLGVWVATPAALQPGVAAGQGAAAAPVAQEAPRHAGGEANLVLPDLGSVDFHGINGRTLLMGGLVVCLGGLAFGLLIFMRLKNLPVHKSMRDISELIYETCKTYLITQGKFILLLQLFIGAIMVVYFGVLQHMGALKVTIILLFSLIGIAGSYGVAWFGIRVNTFANSRAAFASLRGMPFPIYAIPLSAGMSIGMLLISVELFLMLCILLFIPGDYAGACFIGFAIGESLGASVLRIAGGIFTKIADIGSDLMKIVFNIKEDDVRNPGVIADCTGDNAGDSVGPSADGFETYGVTGVALISFILVAVADPSVQVQLLVWIFVMRVVMIIASGASYLLNDVWAKASFADAKTMNFEVPLTRLVWLTSIVSVILTYVASYWLIPTLGGNANLWWQLSTVITCGTLAGAIIPELVKVFTSTESAHVREVVTSSREGGASLNILSGFVAGNFSAYWLGASIVALMSIAYGVSTYDLQGSNLMIAPAVFAFGLVAFGFLGMGPVTIAVDSYGPVTDNAQSVFELSTIESIPNIKQTAEEGLRFRRQFRARQASARRERRRRQHVQGHGQARAHRDRGGRGDDDDFLDRRGADRAAAAGVPAVSVDSAPPVPARTHQRRLHDLLVHRGVDAGGDDRSLPRGRVHQGEHPAGPGRSGVGRGQQEGRRDLHAVRAEGDVQHLPGGVLRHAGLCVPRAVLLHRVSGLDRPLRALPGAFSWPTPAGPGTTRRKSSRSSSRRRARRSMRRPSSATRSAIRSRTPRRWPSTRSSSSRPCSGCSRSSSACSWRPSTARC